MEKLIKKKEYWSKLAQLVLKTIERKGDEYSLFMLLYMTQPKIKKDSDE